TYSRRLMAVCLRYCSSKEQAQDVFQDGFVKIMTKANSYNARGSFEGWMTRIMINTAINELQKWEKRMMNSEDKIPEKAMEPGAISNLSYNEIISLIQQLPRG